VSRDRHQLNGSFWFLNVPKTHFGIVNYKYAKGRLRVEHNFERSVGADLRNDAKTLGVALCRNSVENNCNEKSPGISTCSENAEYSCVSSDLGCEGLHPICRSVSFFDYDKRLILADGGFERGYPSWPAQAEDILHPFRSFDCSGAFTFTVVPAGLRTTKERVRTGGTALGNFVLDHWEMLALGSRRD
jgi:hypothetical protein